MGALEELGYLSHPHTSAGRVPTDQGYQFYVKERVAEEPLPTAWVDLISREIRGKIENLENLMERASRILSAMAEEAALLVISPNREELYLKELNLIPFDATRILAVWCSTSGYFHTSLVEMEEPVALMEMERIRSFINQELVGEPIENLEAELLRRLESKRDSLRHLYERTLQIIRESMKGVGVPRIFVEGSRYILRQPEFQDVRKLQLLMTTLEEKTNLIDFFSSPPLKSGVRVAIGEKELSKDIWDCSLVSAPYLWQGKYGGSVGVLGPRRMRYGRMIGLVRQMAGEIGEALARWSSG